MRYRMMRLMIMFDLPVDTADERREYRQFRKRLINEGTFLENRIKSFLPTSGVVQSLMVTEKQYNDMHFLVGDPVRDVRNSSDRTVIL